MEEKKSIVEEALIQMKNVEQAIAENAKGILRSTMKEEINQLVKESLSEDEEDDDEIKTDDTGMEDGSEEEETTDVDMEDDDIEVDDMEDDDIEVDDMEVDDIDSDEVVDLTGASDEEILKVFKAMGEEDGIIIKKDGSDVHLTDDNTDSEYLIKLSESKKSKFLKEDDSTDYVSDETDKVNVDMVVDKLFREMEEDMEEEMSEDNEEVDEIVYEIEMEEDMEEEMPEDMEEELDEDMEEDMDEIVYEVETELEEEDDDEDEPIFMEDDLDMEESMHESYSHKKSKMGKSKMSIKPKGVGIGSGPGKFSYKEGDKFYKSPKKMKQGTRGVGMGKPKFEYKEGENLEGDMKEVKKVGHKKSSVKKVETKEASRTYGFGSKDNSRGLRKAITPNRNLTFESLEAEVKALREKNEEYRKALNIFRTKLNEVAIFNSNLAYATRLFTEHATTKKEKINILRRFDGVESLKESKNLYKTLKEELAGSQKETTKSINESVSKIDKVVSTGSATNLIENKTYEAPQFLRIKDLMNKIA